eukprot:scaffold7.g3407.t1
MRTRRARPLRALARGCTARRPRRRPVERWLGSPIFFFSDLIYQEPFVGKAAIAAYFQKVERLVPPDIKFVVEDITEGDGRKAGVRWHVELEGIQFPFSRGVSFYEVNDRGQIVFARDVVEPSLKPGGAALRGISFVAPLVRKLGPAADPSALKRLPLAAAGVWAVWAAYLGIVMLSPWPPGAPAWQASPETLQTVLHESFNFFYVNIGLAQLGLNPVPCVAEHPVSEAVFNAMGSWGLLFLPAMLADPRGARVRTKTKLGLWIGTWFLTNCFLPIYMALRLLPEEPGLQAAAAVATPAPPAQRAAPAGDDSGEAAAGAPAYTPALGVVALSVGLLSMWWAGFARPEYGALAERWAYAVQAVTTTRVDWAFGTDALLYSVWQYVLLGAAGAPQWQRAVPFFGMCAWALSGGRQQGPQGD